MTFTPPAQPVSRGNKKGRIVFIVVGGGAVALYLVLCGISAAFLNRAVSQEVEPVRTEVSSYVDDVIAGDYSSAYGRMCDKVRAGVSETEYTRTQSAHDKIRSYQVVDIKIKPVDTTTTATVSLRMVQDGTGREYTQGIFLVKEGGRWRVCEP